MNFLFTSGTALVSWKRALMLTKNGIYPHVIVASHVYSYPAMLDADFLLSILGLICT